MLHHSFESMAIVPVRFYVCDMNHCFGKLLSRMWVLSYYEMTNENLIVTFERLTNHRAASMGATILIPKDSSSN